MSQGPLNELQLILAFFGGPLILGFGPLERYPKARKFQISDSQTNPESKDVCILNMIKGQVPHCGRVKLLGAEEEGTTLH